MTRFPSVLLYCAAAFLFLQIPYVGGVLGWYATFFHELSHGLAALVTGGSVRAFELNFDGSGSLTHSGSRLRVLVSFVGYPGAALFGYLIYRKLGDSAADNRGDVPWLIFIAGVIAVTAGLWMRDPTSWIISGALVGVLMLCRQFLPTNMKTIALRFIGATLLVAAIQSIWILFGLSDKGDASTLAKLLLLPAPVWVVIWIAISLWLIWRLAKQETE